MNKNIFAAGVIAAASFSFVAVANATDIPATPMNHGPMVMHMGLVGEVANVGLTPVNVIAQPILAPGAGAAAEPAEAPMHKHHRRHRKHM